MTRNPEAPQGAGGPDLGRLRRAIGETVEYAGIRCVVHDVVEEPPILVLRPVSGPDTIQADTFGKATRKARALIEIPVFAAGGSEPSEELANVRFPGPSAGR